MERLPYVGGHGLARSAALPEQLAKHPYDFDERSAPIEASA
jgi:hypothetical protein